MRMTKAGFGTLCICALRYCLGRKTYMPSVIMEMCLSNLDMVTTKDLAVMIGDIESWRRAGKDFGDDLEDWERFENAVQAEKSKRDHHR